MTEELYAFDAEYRARAGVVCGVDEAGRGPLCGPVCVAAVILDPAAPVDGVNDSKKLSEKKRELLYPQIIEKALAYKVVMVGPQTIDELNILNATLLGMRQAVEGLAVRPGLALIDGNRYMEQLAKEYTQYQLEKHKGYPTKLHYALLDEYGIQPFYRRSFLKKRGYV